MWQQIVVGAIVLGAVVFLLLRLRRVARGKTICEEGICPECPYASQCDQQAKETPEDAAPICRTDE